MVFTMFEKEYLVFADLGTSHTRIAHNRKPEQVHEYPTLVAYNDQRDIFIGNDAFNKRGAVDLVWIKDSARLSPNELREHPRAFQDFMKKSLMRIGAKPPVILMLSEPALMTTHGRNQIIEHLAQIQGINQVYFFPEAIASALSFNVTGQFTLIDIGDGNTTVQSFNGRAPIIRNKKPLAFQTNRAGRTMTYHCNQVLWDNFDIEMAVTDAGSWNYRYLMMIKEKMLSKENVVKVIDQKDVVRQIRVTFSLQNEIVNCLFDSDLKFRPVQDVIKQSALTVKDIAPGLLSTIYVTGRPFLSEALLRIFIKELNRRLQDTKEALDIQQIEVKRVPNPGRSVLNGMISTAKKIPKTSEKWIDLNDFQ